MKSCLLCKIGLFLALFALSLGKSVPGAQLQEAPPSSNSSCKNETNLFVKDQNIYFRESNNHLFRTFSEAVSNSKDGPTRRENSGTQSGESSAQMKTRSFADEKASVPYANSTKINDNPSTNATTSEPNTSTYNRIPAGHVINYTKVEFLGNAKPLASEIRNNTYYPYEETLPVNKSSYLNDVKVEVDLVSPNGDKGTQIMSKEHVHLYEPPGAIKFYSPEAWKNRKLFYKVKGARNLGPLMKNDSPQLRGFPADISVDPEKGEVKIWKSVSAPERTLKLDATNRQGESRKEMAKMSALVPLFQNRNYMLVVGK